MGIGHTLQQIEGWQGQYHRLRRWHDRVRRAANSQPSRDEFDFLLAFFESCFHLRDWLLADKVVTKVELDSLFNSYIELGICRDIANGFKHSKITWPSVDAGFTIVREYVPDDWPSSYRYPNGKWTVLASDHQLGLVDLADNCVGIWQRFLSSKGLLPTASER
jgi:hypothetical protein